MKIRIAKKRARRADRGEARAYRQKWKDAADSAMRYVRTLDYCAQFMGGLSLGNALLEDGVIGDQRGYDAAERAPFRFRDVLATRESFL